MNTSRPITPRQKEILDFIHETLEERNYAPSHREIARHFRFSGTRAVQKHLLALQKKGALEKGHGARALNLKQRSIGRPIPIIGSVAAGKPMLAEENISSTLTVDSSVARWKDCFFLKVKGHSMKEAAILDGDLVMVRPQKSADFGDIVVAMHEGEATVKRLVKKEGRIYLMPENPDFKPIEVTERENFEVVGKVMGVFRF